jgi:hypothetical protein
MWSIVHARMRPVNPQLIRHSRRRVALYRERAAELARDAVRVRGNDDRRHFLNLSRTYERTANAIASRADAEAD